MSEVLINFLKEYDSGDLKFNNLKYRTGAAITGHFGIEQGFSIIKGKLVFDTVRIHPGVDRKEGEILSPFNFDFAIYTDYGKDHPFGSLIRLFNFKYLFEMRIAHTQPEEITPEFMKMVTSNSAIPRNTKIGIAGNYGASSGRHTHTEFLSILTTCPVLDELLIKKFKNDVNQTYSLNTIEKFYRNVPVFKNAGLKEIKDHWQKQLDSRQIVSNVIAPQGEVNDYRIKYKDWFYGREIKTKYSTEKLFNGL